MFGVDEIKRYLNNFHKSVRIIWRKCYSCYNRLFFKGIYLNIDMKILALGDPHGKLPKNLGLIIKQNKIETIICIGEVFPIKRDKKNTGKANLRSGEKILDKLCSYNLPMIFFKGNMFRVGEGAKYFRDLIKKYKNKYPNLKYKELFESLLLGLGAALVFYISAVTLDFDKTESLLYSMIVAYLVNFILNARKYYAFFKQ